MVNGQAWKVLWFSSNGFWKNIGCLISNPAFGLGESRIWEKEYVQRIIGNNENRHPIRVKVDLYEVCLYYTIYCLLLFYDYANTLFFARFVASLTPGERSSGIIGHKDSGWERTRI